MSATPKLYDFRGERLTLDEIAARTGQPKRRLYNRVRHLGWTLERAVSTGRISESERGRMAKATAFRQW